MKLYAPFPSRLSVNIDGKDIVLTWKDAADVDEGVYEIYRGNRALTAENLNTAVKIAEVPAETETYIDNPQIGEEVYYAVFVRDSSQVYKICIPFRNVTTSPSIISKADIEETISTIVSDLKAKVIDSEVTLTYKSTLNDRSIMLFRNTSPINNYEALLKSIYIGEQDNKENSIIDTPIAGLNYYYAAVDAKLYRSGNQDLIYDGDFTTKPVYIPFSHEIKEDNRFIKSAMPLPLLKISRDLQSGRLLEEKEEPKEKRELTKETLQLVDRLTDKNNLNRLEAEKTTLAYNRNINSIISSQFLSGQWEQCLLSLEPFTTSRYDEETRNQSHFYRGQCYYYLGLYNRALREFIMVEQSYYVETKPFFNAIFDL